MSKDRVEAALSRLQKKYETLGTGRIVVTDLDVANALQFWEVVAVFTSNYKKYEIVSGIVEAKGEKKYRLVFAETPEDQRKQMKSRLEELLTED